MHFIFTFPCLWKDKSSDCVFQEIFWSEDEEEEDSDSKIRAPVGEPSKMEQGSVITLIPSELELESPELKSPHKTEYNKCGRTKRRNHLLKYGKQMIFTKLYAATSWMTLRPSVMFNRPGTPHQNVRWTSSPGRNDTRDIPVSFVPKEQPG
jgi:hypothetical protein